MPGASGQVVVIGGGVSGLSAAYDLTRAGVQCTVLEKQPRLGGVIETRCWQNCVLECGPDSFLSAKPDALALIKELGLESEVIGSNDQQRTTYILRRGRLVPMPDGVMMIVPTKAAPILKSRLLSWPTKIRMGLEFFRRPGYSPDRSVAEFVADHFGEETLDYLAEPLLSGIYGGDPRELSVASVLPRFLQMEAKHGSLVRGALRSRATEPSTGSIFLTLKSGLGKLIERLAAGLTVVHKEVETVERREGGGFRVRADGGWMEAAHVVLACPAWAAARLLAGTDAEIARWLGGIRYSSSLTLSLVYQASEFDGLRAGFGFLVPKRERQRLAACTFAATKFPHRAPEDRIILRCFFGGTGDEAVLGESVESLVAIARDELRRILGLTAEPVFHTVARWPESMAQYNVGHAARVQQIEARAAVLPGLHLAGNAFRGIGIPDCVSTGRQAAADILTLRTHKRDD